VAKSGARVAIVTGGTRGIGRAIVDRLAGEDYAVIFSGRDAKAAEKTAAALRAEGHTAVGVAADARREEDQRRLVERARSEFGRLDALVNNAGIGAFGRVD
jgi:3-oxoacyl-[acyl-carrier protein] reductase